MLCKKYVIALLIGTALLTTGCATNFVKPAQNALTIGKSNSEEVKKLVPGSSYKQVVTVNNEQVSTFTYQYMFNNVFYGSIIPHRSLIYSFFNDVLVGEEFNSSYEEEKTEFDIKKVAEIRKGQTLDQVIAIMGNPSGKIVYPLISDKAGSGIVYAYSYTRFVPIYSPTTSHLLIIAFDQNNVVTNISYKLDGKEQINI